MKHLLSSEHVFIHLSCTAFPSFTMALRCPVVASDGRIGEDRFNNCTYHLLVPFLRQCESVVVYMCVHQWLSRTYFVVLC